MAGKWATQYMSLGSLVLCNSARLAQSVEHETLNLRVVGSSPTLGDHLFPHQAWFCVPICDILPD